MTPHTHDHPLPIVEPTAPPLLEEDPASRSLADALRVCFGVLKVVMLALLVVYLFSGVFNVHPQEAAVHLRFGKVVGPPGQQVLESGGPYFALPYPLEQIVRIPTFPQQIELNHEFWYEQPLGLASVAQTQRPKTPGPLNPEKDGSLLSGDTNILHARWAVTFTVTRPLDYTTHVPDHDAGFQLVRAAAEEGIVLAAAQTPADQLIRSQEIPLAKTIAQQALDALQCGITINTLQIKDPIFPLSVQPAVQQVLDAETEKARLMEEAQQHWETTLGQTAGQAYRPLMNLIRQYEQASSPLAAEHQRTPALLDRLDRAFDQLLIHDSGQSFPIGGEVAQLIHEAQSYRFEAVARIRGEAQYFQSLLPQYRGNPAILLSRLWQDAQQQIFTGDIETLYLPPGQVYLELNRDPAIRSERERKQLSSQDESTKEPGSDRR